MTAAPRVDEDEGVGTYLKDQTTFYFLDQSDRQTLWSLAFGEFITTTNLGTWRTQATTIAKPPGGWVLADGTNRLWIKSGTLEWGRRPTMDLNPIAAPAHINLAVVGGVLEYTP